MKQGLLQEAVLSPLLFLFYIDAVRQVVPKGVAVRMHVDDLALYAQHHDKVLPPLLIAFRAEAEVPAMRTAIRRNFSIAREKTLHLPVSNPRSRLIKDVPHRLQSKSSWRQMAKQEEKVTWLGDLPRFPLPPQASPWGAQKVRRWSTREDICPQVNRKSDAQQLKDAAMEAIRLQGPLSGSYTQMGPLVGTTTIVGQWR